LFLFWPLAGLVLLAGCKDSPLGPEQFGRIEGRVADFATNAALGGASVSTSPPSDAPVTGDDGSFVFDEVPVGNYTITARRSGYSAGTTTVSVQEGRTTRADVFLSVPGAVDTSASNLTAEVTNFFNRVRTGTQGDSVTVVVDYSVRNTGTEAVSDYEVYFRVVTPSGDFFQEIQGESVGVGQRDIGRFEKDTGGARATEVVVDGMFVGQGRPATARADRARTARTSGR